MTQLLANALGYPMNYQHPSQIMDEIAALTPTFRGVSYDKIDRLGSLQWPCNEDTDEAGTADHARRRASCAARAASSSRSTCRPTRR